MVTIRKDVNKLELGTFGAVMKFALQIESESLEIYSKILEDSEGDEISSLFKKLIDGCSNRRKNLERVRRENITEMILEPIKDFESSEYELPEAILTRADQFKDLLILIEEKKRNFYSAASLKIEFLIEAAGIFEELAEENESNIAQIESIVKL